MMKRENYHHKSEVDVIVSGMRVVSLRKIGAMLFFADQFFTLSCPDQLVIW